MSENLDFEIDMAQLSLRGQRFNEAEERFLALAKNNSSSLAWCGVALAKSGLLYSENATVSEVFYCFEKALSVEPANEGDIKKVAYHSVLQMTSSFADFYAFELVREKEADWQKTKGYILGVGSALSGALDKRQNGFTNLTALGGEVLGFATVANAQGKLTSARMNKEKIIQLIKDLKQRSLDLFKPESEEYRNLEKTIDTTVRSLVSPITQYLEGNFVTGERPQLSSDELFQLVDARINSYKKTRKTWGWVILFFAACSFFSGLYLEADETMDDERYEKIAVGVGLIIGAIVLFVKASGMTFDKMEIQIKKEYGIED